MPTFIFKIIIFKLNNLTNSKLRAKILQSLKKLKVASTQPATKLIRRHYGRKPSPINDFGLFAELTTSRKNYLATLML